MARLDDDADINQRLLDLLSDGHMTADVTPALLDEGFSLDDIEDAIRDLSGWW
jgi:hypothetical protein